MKDLSADELLEFIKEVLENREERARKSGLYDTANQIKLTKREILRKIKKRYGDPPKAR